jgi:hypothetical protein
MLSRDPEKRLAPPPRYHEPRGIGHAPTIFVGGEIHNAVGYDDVDRVVRQRNVLKLFFKVRVACRDGICSARSPHGVFICSDSARQLRICCCIMAQHSQAAFSNFCLLRIFTSPRVWAISPAFCNIPSATVTLERPPCLRATVPCEIRHRITD